MTTRLQPRERAALLLLARLRLRGAARALREQFRRPMRAAGILLIVALFVAMVVSQADESTALATTAVRELVPVYMTAFLGMILWASARSSSLGFLPAEAQMLFPAPLSTRALVAWRLAVNFARLLPNALVFGVLVNGRSGAGPATLAWACFFLFLSALAMNVSLAVVGVDARTRDRRARALRLALTTIAAVAIGAGWLLRTPGEPLSTARFIAAPGLPFAMMMTEPWLEAVGWGAGTTAVSAWLVRRCLRFEGPVRERAGEVSRDLERRFERMRRGSAFGDRPRERSRSIVPALPRWGGAGPHVRRQLIALTRLRRPFALLFLFAALLQVPQAFLGRWEPMSAGALAMLLIVGPWYVQCDFRSDYEVLPYLRSLPTSPSRLALGQLLASSAVLFVVQLVCCGWVVFVVDDERRLPWLAAFAVLPVVDMIVLGIFNGAYLVAPTRLVGRDGQPPSLADVGRIYATMVVQLVLLAGFLGVAGGVTFGAAATLRWLGAPDLVGLAAIAGFGVLLVEAALVVWIVGRLFLRVDPSRDLR